VQYSPADWFWIGQPVGQSSVIIYSSAAGAVVPPTNAAYEAFLAGGNAATPWPRDATGAVTTAALDAVLTAAFPPQPPTGLTTPTQASLQASLVAAATAAAASVTAQVYTDPSHQAAGQNAGLIVVMAGGAPTSSSPFFSAFNSYAAAWGLTPAAFATLIETLVNESMALSSALNTLEAATSSATTAAQLATALSAFETAVNAVVTAINAAGTPFPMTPPPAISIPGINA
jgi:hypothetical protein